MKLGVTISHLGDETGRVWLTVSYPSRAWVNFYYLLGFGLILLTYKLSFHWHFLPYLYKCWLKLILYSYICHPQCWIWCKLTRSDSLPPPQMKSFRSLEINSPIPCKWVGSVVDRDLDPLSMVPDGSGSRCQSCLGNESPYLIFTGWIFFFYQKQYLN